MLARALRFVAALQVLLLLSTLLLPGLVAATEPDPSASAPASTGPATTPDPAPTTDPTQPDPTAPPTPSGPPTISSDKADYAPGELVTLTGTNWAVGEIVHIYVNDELGSSWSRNVDVTAGSDGTVVDQFNLPTWFVSNYVVVATGASSGTALAAAKSGESASKTRRTSVRQRREAMSAAR